MTRHDPYFVRRGWVDEDGHIRVVESSLKIMHNMHDVHGEEATDDDALTGLHTYPAPSDHANDNVYTTGYFYLGEMVDLAYSTPPPSPLEETEPSPFTTSESAEDGESATLATVTASKLNLHFPPPLPPAQNTHPVNQISKIYNHSLPYATLQNSDQARYAPPVRPIAPRLDVLMRHDLASTYGGFSTGHPLASLPTATHNAAPPAMSFAGSALPAPHMAFHPNLIHNAAPPVTHQTGFAIPAPNMAFFPNASLHNAAPPVMPQTSFAPPVPNATSLHSAVFHNAAPAVLPHNGFMPPVPTMAYPYRPVNAPVPPPGYATLSFSNGSLAGQPVPPDLHPIINAIHNLPKIRGTDHPQRATLKKPYEGTYQNAPRDRQLIRDHFAGGSGVLKTDSPLREWYGDLSVFSAEMWDFLAVQKTRLQGYVAEWCSPT